MAFLLQVSPTKNCIHFFLPCACHVPPPPFMLPIQQHLTRSANREVGNDAVLLIRSANREVGNDAVPLIRSANREAGNDAVPSSLIFLPPS